MKLAIILAGDIKREYREQRKNFIENFVSPGTNVEVLKTGGPKSINNPIDLALVGSGAVKQVIEAEKNGFDGVSL